MAQSRGNGQGNEGNEGKRLADGVEQRRERRRAPRVDEQRMLHLPLERREEHPREPVAAGQVQHDALAEAAAHAGDELARLEELLGVDAAGARDGAGEPVVDVALVCEVSALDRPHPAYRTGHRYQRVLLMREITSSCINMTDSRSKAYLKIK